MEKDAEPNSARALIETKAVQTANLTKKLDMWPYGIPLDQEKNFWELTLVLIGLMFTQFGYVIVQNFVARAGRIMLSDSNIGFYSQGVLYLSFALTTILFGPCLNRLFNLRAAIVFFLGAGFRTFWGACLVPAAMRHELLTSSTKTNEDLMQWYYLKDNIGVLLIFGAVFTGIFFGATFLAFIQYLD